MPKRYFITRRMVASVLTAAEKAEIHEICGVVFGRGSQIERILQVPNRAEDTVCHGVIWNSDVERVRKKASVANMKILGYLHNHPLSPALPSPGDLRGWDIGTLIFICSDLRKEFRAFRTVSRRRYVEKEIKIVDQLEPHRLRKIRPKAIRRISR